MSTSNVRQRSKQALIRMTEEEHAELAGRADAAGLTLADYIRSQALAAKPLRAQRRPSADRAELARLLGQIGAIGNNVNQIARSLNRGRPEDEALIADTFRAIQQMENAVLIALGINSTGGKRE